MKKSTILKESERIKTLKGERAEDAAAALKADIEDALSRCAALKHFNWMSGRDECLVEDDGPLIQISYNMEISNRYATELRFELRAGKFYCVVRLWRFNDNAGECSKDYEVEGDGEYDDDVEGAIIQEIAKAAVEKVIDHRERLLENVGVIIRPETRRRALLKPQGLVI